MMKLKDLNMKNFMLFKEATVSFKKGLTFIDGINRDNPGAVSNHSGKSILAVEALVWCWFGKTVRNLEDVKGVIRRGSTEKCEVSNTFISGEDKYEIIRSRSAFSSDLIILQNDKDITPAKDAQKLIDNLIGVDYRIFIQACVFSQNNRFCFIEQPNAEQKKIIEDIIDFKQYHDYLRSVRDHISDATDRYVSLNTTLEKLKTRIKTLKEERGRLEEAKANSEAREIVSRTEVEKWKARRKKLVKFLDSLHVKENKVKELRRVRILNEEGWDLKVTVWKTKLQEAEVLIGAGVCPTCKQEVDSKAIEHECEDLESELARSQLCYKKSVKAATKIKTIYKKIQNKVKEKEKIKIKLDTKILYAKTTTVFDDVLYIKQLKEVKSSIRMAKEEQLLTIQERKKIEKKGEYLGFLEEAWSRDGIESILLDSILPFLNIRVQHYASIFSDDRMTITFATLKKTKKGYKDSFHVKVVTSDGSESYGGCSGSEVRFANLAVAFAFRDLANASGASVPPILLLDEIDDAVDPVGSERLSQYIHEYSKNKIVWLISHNPVMREIYDHKIEVIKEKGISFIKGE